MRTIKAPKESKEPKEFKAPKWKHLKLYQSKHPRTPWRVVYKQGGDRISKWFTDREDAMGWGDEKDIELTNQGVSEAAVSPVERKALTLWRESGIQRVSLVDVIGEFVAREKMRRQSATLQDAVDSLLARRQTEGKSRKTIIDLDYRLKRFVEAFGGGAPISDIGTKDTDRWLTQLSETFSPQSVKNFRRVVHGLFTHAVSRGWAEKNPVKDSLNPKVKHKDVCIYTPTQAKAMLTHCAEDARAALVLSMFSGLRTAEIVGLDWEQVDLAAGHVRVIRSKTGRPRMAHLPPNAVAWLKQSKSRRGLVWAQSDRVLAQRWEAARTDAEIAEALPNAGRHSFGSYRAAITQDLPKVAFEMGNSVEMVRRHYQEIVTKAQAAKYWAIKP
jgi:site-specific recombinase XerD